MEKIIEVATYSLGDHVKIHGSYSNEWVVVGVGSFAMINGGDDVKYYILQCGTNQVVVPFYSIEKLA